MSSWPTYKTDTWSRHVIDIERSWLTVDWSCNERCRRQTEGHVTVTYVNVRPSTTDAGLASRPLVVVMVMMMMMMWWSSVYWRTTSCLTELSTTATTSTVRHSWDTCLVVMTASSLRSERCSLTSSVCRSASLTLKCLQIHSVMTSTRVCLSVCLSVCLLLGLMT